MRSNGVWLDVRVHDRMCTEQRGRACIEHVRDGARLPEIISQDAHGHCFGLRASSHAHWAMRFRGRRLGRCALWFLSKAWTRGDAGVDLAVDMAVDSRRYIKAAIELGRCTPTLVGQGQRISRRISRACSLPFLPHYSPLSLLFLVFAFEFPFHFINHPFISSCASQPSLP